MCSLLTAMPLLQIIHAIAVARSRPAWPMTAPKPLVVSHSDQPAAAAASLSGPQRLGSCSVGNIVAVMTFVMLGRDASQAFSACCCTFQCSPASLPPRCHIDSLKYLPSQHAKCRRAAA